MNTKRSSAAFLVLFALGYAARAQETLVWRAFDEKNRVFYQKMHTRTVQNMKVAGKEVIQNQEQTFWVSWTPRGKKGRDWVVVQRIEGVKMDIAVGGNRIRYDSTAPEGPETPMTAFFRAMVGAEFTLTIGPDDKGDFRVKDVTGQAELIDRLSAANPTLRPILENVLSPDAVKKMAEPVLAWTPRKSVGVGDTWKKESVMDLGPIGTYTSTNGYTYQGNDQGLQRILVSGVLKYSAPIKKEGLPFIVKEADLKSDPKTNTGVIFFDREKGRVASARMHTDLAGTLTIEIKGEETRVELTQSQDVTVETTDTNPLPTIPAPARADDTGSPSVLDHWDVAYLQGSRAGYVHTLVQESEEKGDKRYTSTITLHLAVKRNKELIQLHSEAGDTANEQGKVLKLLSRQTLGKDKQLEITGVVDGPELRLTRDKTAPLPPVAWDSSAIGIFKQRQFLAQRKAKPGEKFSYKAFELSLNRAIQTNVEVKDYEDVDLLDDQVKKRLLRVVTRPEKTAEVELPAVVTWVDSNYIPLRSDMEIPGLGAITLYKSTRASALRPTETLNLTDVGANQVVSIEKRISRPYDARSAAYRITLRSDDDPGSAFTKDDRQHVTNVRGDRIDLAVQASQAPTGGKDKQPGVEFTASSYFINSGDKRVREIARQAVGDEQDPWQKALRIEKWVNGNMTSVNDQGLTPADEAARTLKGDCTEYAMLTAAMCRAEGLPSRTAIGLVYADGAKDPAFTFHMWTEVWVKGRWAALDATLGRGGITATHLKVADQSWHDTVTLGPLLPVVRLFGKVSIEVLNVEYPAP